MADLSKIQLPSGSTYDLKDAHARQLITGLTAVVGHGTLGSGQTSHDTRLSTLQAAVSSLTGGGLVYEVKASYAALGAASESTAGRIYLVPASEAADHNIYDEYMTVKIGSEYKWEKIGSTDIDLSDYAKTGDSVTASGSYKPAGINTASNVTFGAGTTIYSMDSDGTVTDGHANVPTKPAVIDTSKFDGGSFTNGTLAALTTTVSNECLTIGWTAPTESTFTKAEIQSGFYTAGVEGTASTPTAVTLPTRGTRISVVTTDTTATAAAQTFTGTDATINVSGTID